MGDGYHHGNLKEQLILAGMVTSQLFRPVANIAHMAANIIAAER